MSQLNVFETVVVNYETVSIKLLTNYWPAILKAKTEITAIVLRNYSCVNEVLVVIRYDKSALWLTTG